MSENQNQQHDIIKRESGGEPWVEEALHKREEALDAVVAAGGHSADQHLHDAHKYWAAQAVLRKESMGVEQPDPLPIEETPSD